MNGYIKAADTLQQLIDRDPNTWFARHFVKPGEDYDQALNRYMPGMRLMQTEQRIRGQKIDEVRDLLSRTNLARYLPSQETTNPFELTADQGSAVLKNLPMRLYTPQLRKRLRRLCGMPIHAKFRGPQNKACTFGANPKNGNDRVNIYLKFPKSETLKQPGMPKLIYGTICPGDSGDRY